MSMSLRLRSLAGHRCPECGSELQPEGTILYCLGCKRTQSIVDDSNRQINYTYNPRRHESKPKEALNSALLKIAKDIFCKIGMRPSQSQMNAIVEKVKFMHKKRGPNRKGYREEAAAIVYKEFEDQIRMNLHQFCEKVGVEKKKFNKMYINYQNLVKQSYYQAELTTANQTKALKYEHQDDDFNLEDDQALKKQQNGEAGQGVMGPEACKLLKKQQQERNQLFFDSEPEQQHYRLQNQIQRPNARLVRRNSNEFDDENQRKLLTKTLERLFTDIFPSSYLSTFKQELTSSIIQKALIISHAYLRSRPVNCLKGFFRAPTIIYCIIKMKGAKVSKKNYLAAVKNNLDVQITERMISLFWSICRTVLQKKQEDDEPSDSVSSNRNESQTSAQNQLKNLEELMACDNV